VAKNPMIFEMFSETFMTVARDSLHTRFKFTFFVTEEHSIHFKPTLPFQVQQHLRLCLCPHHRSPRSLAARTL
jgi:hypothetical protein